MDVTENCRQDNCSQEGGLAPASDWMASKLVGVNHPFQLQVPNKGQLLETSNEFTIIERHSDYSNPILYTLPRYCAPPVGPNWAAFLLAACGGNGFPGAAPDSELAVGKGGLPPPNLDAIQSERGKYPS